MRKRFVDDVFCQHGQAEKVVHRYIEKALYLRRVQIHGKHSVRSRRRNEIRHEFCRNGIARSGFSILAGIAEIGHYGGDTAGRSAAHSVNNDEQFDKVVVYGRRRGLNDEYVAAAYRFVYLNADLSVGEFTHHHVAERHMQFFGDLLCQSLVTVAGKELDFISVRYHWNSSVLFMSYKL